MSDDEPSSFLDTPELRAREALLDRVSAVLDQRPMGRQYVAILAFQETDRLRDSIGVVEGNWDAPTEGSHDELCIRTLVAVAHLEHWNRLRIMLGWYTFEHLEAFADALEAGYEPVIIESEASPNV